HDPAPSFSFARCSGFAKVSAEQQDLVMADYTFALRLELVSLRVPHTFAVFANVWETQRSRRVVNDFRRRGAGCPRFASVFWTLTWAGAIRRVLVDVVLGGSAGLQPGDTGRNKNSVFSPGDGTKTQMKRIGEERSDARGSYAAVPLCENCAVPEGTRVQFPLLPRACARG